MKFDSIQNCVFDFDHTLIDTKSAFAAYRNELSSQLHKFTHLDVNEIDDAIFQTGQKLESQFFASRLDLIEKNPIAIRLKKLTDNERKQIALAVRTAFHRHLRQYEHREAIEFMLDCAVRANKKLYMFTGGSPAHTVDKVMGSNLSRYFKTVYTGDFHPFEDLLDSGVIDWNFFDEREGLASIVLLKPNPKSSPHGYELLLSHAQLEPEQTLMIGNHFRDDVQSAQQAGLRTAQVTWFSRDVSDGVVADVLLDEPTDLFAL